LDENFGRYARQTRLPEIGMEGQRKLSQSSVLVVGCGALGSTLASTLVRAGIGLVRIVDRDVLELNNLQRQVLFDEDDVAKGLPKAEAAVSKLRKINSSVGVEGHVTDVTPKNIESLMAEVSLVLDATDNFESRYVINDAAVKHGVPWIYGGVIGMTGMTMNVLPGTGPCLRCVFPTAPPAGSFPTCETAGVLNTVPAVIASIQATEALKILSGDEPSLQMVYVDMWKQSFRQMAVSRDDNCPACGLYRFDFLSTEETAWTTTLCGRNAVQITPAEGVVLELEKLSGDLATMGEVSFNGSILRFVVNDHEMLLFPDGRAMINGTDDEKLARSLYARYVGS
jgi:molybdopterin/thiamine biosynthesis adenylyltransferase